MESPYVFVSAVLWNDAGFATKSEANQVLLGLFVLHYVNRSFIYPARMAAGKPMPLCIMLMACSFSCCNDYLQTRYLTKFYIYTETWVSSPEYILGLLIFFAGFYMNLDSDYILRELRKKKCAKTKADRESPDSMRTRRQANEEPEAERNSVSQISSYCIPRGGLFEYISGANFFGEMVEWIGFAVASGRSFPNVMFSLFTILNQAPRAWHHHMWYKNHFGKKYPAERKALIPFIF